MTTGIKKEEILRDVHEMENILTRIGKEQHTTRQKEERVKPSV